MSWATKLRRGAASGFFGGIAAIAVLWALVEPAINRAIALEGEVPGHSHGPETTAPHEHAEELVSRLEQQVAGSLTIVVVACLLGLVFAAVYSSLQHRLPARTPVGKALALAALTFVAHSLVPALVAPANPPGVGDPATVDRRSLAWFVSILLTVLVIAAAFSADRYMATSTQVSSATRLAAVTGVGLIGLVLILLFAPSMPVDVPEEFPAQLLWDFRVGSLAQLAAMWLGTGLAFGLLTARSERHLDAAPRRTPAAARA